MQKTTSQESHKLHQLLLELTIQYSFRTENQESEAKWVSILPDSWRVDSTLASILWGLWPRAFHMDKLSTYLSE